MLTARALYWPTLRIRLRFSRLRRSAIRHEKGIHCDPCCGIEPLVPSHFARDRESNAAPILRNFAGTRLMFPAERLGICPSRKSQISASASASLRTFLASASKQRQHFGPPWPPGVRFPHSPATRATCLTKGPHAIHNFSGAMRGDVGNMPHCARRFCASAQKRLAFASKKSMCVDVRGGRACLVDSPSPRRSHRSGARVSEGLGLAGLPSRRKGLSPCQSKLPIRSSSC